MGMVGHDLRNPLTAIKLSAQALRGSSSLSPADRQEIALIEHGANRMRRLTEDLLEFTRSRLGGGFPIEPQRVDLHDLCYRLIREYKAFYPGRKIELSLEGDGEGECDPDRVWQVLSNLLDNPLRHSPPDTPVRVGVRNHEGECSFVIHNLGLPIPAEEMELIFLPYIQGQQREGNKQGLGLGLYIVDQIIRAGGTLNLRSTIEEGTTFTFRLPGPRTHSD